MADINWFGVSVFIGLVAAIVWGTVVASRESWKAWRTTTGVSAKGWIASVTALLGWCGLLRGAELRDYLYYLLVGL